jgi:ATP-binding protein involved in chromosome partitioning
MTPEKILEALSNVQEPDLGKDLVTLNMVKDIEINGNNVRLLLCSLLRHAVKRYDR